MNGTTYVGKFDEQNWGDSVSAVNAGKPDADRPLTDTDHGPG